jgi:N-6 DNA Methylase
MVKHPSIHQTRKTFEKLFNNAFLFRRNKFDGWSDWLTITSCSIHQGLYQLGVLEADELSQQVEEEFLAVANRNTPEQMGYFRQLTATVAQLIQSGYDIMGDLFQLMELHNPHAAQYFTPPDVAALLVRLGMGNLKEQIEDHGRVTIADHACGSGGLLLAAADYIESLGYDPKEVAVFEGIDLDRDCFNMAYTQLSLRGLQAVIHHGNTLTLEIHETRCTPMLRMYQCWQWDMEQRRKKDEGIAAMFALVGCTSNIPFEPVPFMQWAAMPKPKSEHLKRWMDDLLDDGRNDSRIEHKDGSGREDKPHLPRETSTGTSAQPILDATQTVVVEVPVFIDEAEASPQPKAKTRKSKKIQINPNVEQLNLFD